MEVPWSMLSPQALRGVLEEFVTREGTDYGAAYTLAQKVDHVLAQIKRGEATIVFDHDSETCNVVMKRPGQNLDDPEEILRLAEQTSDPSDPA